MRLRPDGREQPDWVRLVRDSRRAPAQLPVRLEEPPSLADQAWVIADELGLAKTHDAELLALAKLHSTLLVSADAQLRRAGGSVGFRVDPVELGALGRG
jgi:predicted nucleic acid-binding protein